MGAMSSVPQPSVPTSREPRLSRPTPAAQRAEEFLQRVLPGPVADDEPEPVPGGVDERTQVLLEAMGHDDRESW
jgi:hypothetical protein